MTIGYAVEGTIDRGLVRGLRGRWVPRADLVEGASRGQTKLSLRRELKQICTELQLKGAHFYVFLTDADDANWDEKRTSELELVPARFRGFTVYGVADRNVECWLRADPTCLAEALDIDAHELARASDPKGLVEGALNGLTPWGKEERIEAVVRDADLRTWLECSRSFERFYEDTRSMAQRNGCAFPNEREG